MYLALDRPHFSGSICCPVKVPSLNCMNECSYADLNIYTTLLKQTHSSDKLNFFKNYFTSGYRTVMCIAVRRNWESLWRLKTFPPG